MVKPAKYRSSTNWHWRGACAAKLVQSAVDPDNFFRLTIGLYNVLGPFRRYMYAVTLFRAASAGAIHQNSAHDASSQSKKVRSIDDIQALGLLKT